MNRVRQIVDDVLESISPKEWFKQRATASSAGNFTFKVIKIGDEYGPYGISIFDGRGQRVDWHGSCDTAEQAHDLGRTWKILLNRLNDRLPYRPTKYAKYIDWYSKAYRLVINA